MIRINIPTKYTKFKSEITRIMIKTSNPKSVSPN